MPSGKVITQNDLLRLLRQTARIVQQGGQSDAHALSVSLAAWSKKRPMMGSDLQSLIDAAQFEAARGEMESALDHFRAAIEMLSGTPSGRVDHSVRRMWTTVRRAAGRAS